MRETKVVVIPMAEFEESARVFARAKLEMNLLDGEPLDDAKTRELLRIMKRKQN